MLIALQVVGKVEPASAFCNAARQVAASNNGPLRPVYTCNLCCDFLLLMDVNK